MDTNAATEEAGHPEAGRSNDITNKEAPRRQTRHSRKMSVEIGVNEAKALQKSGSHRDNALEKLAAQDVLTSSGADAGTSSEGNKLELSVEFGRRVHATPAQQRRDTTGLDLDDDVFDALDDSLEDDEEVPQAPASGQRSTDTSSLTASIFNKRRGRAPSISLHGNDSAAIRPSSRAGVSGTPAVSSSFNISAFKRRAREPSILGTGRKPLAESAINVSSDTPSDEDEDDFAPEAESTPLNRRKTQPAVEAEAAEGSSSVRSRKRKSLGAHEASDRPEKTSRVESDSHPEAEVEHEPEAEAEVPELEDLAAEEDADSDLSSLPSLPSPNLPQLQPHRPSTPLNQTDLMAPPESSGSEDEEVWRPGQYVPANRRRQGAVTPTRNANLSDVSSPPSLTHSPNLPATRRQQAKKKGKGSPKTTTASLTDLLPRRRQRKAQDGGSSDAEIDGSALAHDQDELSYIDARPSRRRGKTTPLGRGNAANRATSGRDAAQDKTTPVRRRAVRTYGRRSSDKENQSDQEETGLSPAPDDTFDGGEETTEVADELKNAVKKFQEVDQWQMEFEEMTQSSSPSGAR